MKPLVAFAGGALLAAAGFGIFLLGRKSAEAPAPVVQAVVPAPAPSVTPVPEVTPTPAPPVESKAAVAPNWRKASDVRPGDVRQSKPVGKPSPMEAAPSSPVVAAAPATPTVAAAPAPTPEPVVAEAQKPAPTPMGILRPDAAQPPAPMPANRVTIAAGTLLTVRLQETLSSEKNKDGDHFSAILDQPLVVEGFVLAERGARVEGRVVDSVQAGRVKGVSELGVELVSLTTSDGQRVRLSTEEYKKEGERSRGADAAKVGALAGIGAAIGAIAGGGKGAAIGAGVGGGAGAGTVLATRGKATVLPVETRLSFRTKTAVTVTERR